MIKEIWKFKLKVTDKQEIKMPKGAEILTIQTQDNHPCLWALVQPSAVQEKRLFEIYGTGHPVQCTSRVNRKYISTFQLQGGSLVFHAFEYTGV